VKLTQNNSNNYIHLHEHIPQIKAPVKLAAAVKHVKMCRAHLRHCHWMAIPMAMSDLHRRERGDHL